MEPRYNEPELYNEVLGITKDFLIPSNRKMYGKVPRYNETSRRYREQILPFSWYFVISRFHCNEFFPLHPNLPTFFPLICKVILFCSLIYIFLNQNRSLHNLKNAKIVWNWRLQIILCGVLEGLEHRNAINTVTDPGEGSGGQPPPPPPYFLDQTETRRAEKIFLSPGTPSPLISGSWWPARG